MIIDFNRYNGGGGSGSGVTPAQVQQQIDSALTPYWESGETKDYVDGAVSGISLDGYATSGDMQSAFTLISETQQVAAAGLNQLEGRIDELSGATPSTEEIELPIAAAVNELKGNIEARLNQKYYTRQEVNDIAARKTEPGQVNVQIQDYVDPAIAEVNETIEDKELATSAALNDLNTATVKSSVVKNIWSGTQSEYDAIVTKDPTTLYIIKD